MSKQDDKPIGVSISVSSVAFPRNWSIVLQRYISKCMPLLKLFTSLLTIYRDLLSIHEVFNRQKLYLNLDRLKPFSEVRIPIRTCSRYGAFYIIERNSYYIKVLPD